jgi:hypothetical protein
MRLGFGNNESQSEAPLRRGKDAESDTYLRCRSEVRSRAEDFKQSQARPERVRGGDRAFL